MQGSGSLHVNSPSTSKIQFSSFPNTASGSRLPQAQQSRARQVPLGPHLSPDSFCSLARLPLPKNATVLWIRYDKGKGKIWDTDQEQAWSHALSLARKIACKEAKASSSHLSHQPADPSTSSAVHHLFHGTLFIIDQHSSSIWSFTLNVERRDDPDPTSRRLQQDLSQSLADLQDCEKRGSYKLSDLFQPLWKGDNHPELCSAVISLEAHREAHDHFLTALKQRLIDSAIWGRWAELERLRTSSGVEVCESSSPHQDQVVGEELDEMGKGSHMDLEGGMAEASPSYPPTTPVQPPKPLFKPEDIAESQKMGSPTCKGASSVTMTGPDTPKHDLSRSTSAADPQPQTTAGVLSDLIASTTGSKRSLFRLSNDMIMVPGNKQAVSQFDCSQGYTQDVTSETGHGVLFASISVYTTPSSLMVQSMPSPAPYGLSRSADQRASLILMPNGVKAVFHRWLHLDADSSPLSHDPASVKSDNEGGTGTSRCPIDEIVNELELFGIDKPAVLGPQWAVCSLITAASGPADERASQLFLWPSALCLVNCASNEIAGPSIRTGKPASVTSTPLRELSAATLRMLRGLSAFPETPVPVLEGIFGPPKSSPALVIDSNETTAEPNQAPDPAELVTQMPKSESPTARTLLAAGDQTARSTLAAIEAEPATAAQSFSADSVGFSWLGLATEMGGASRGSRNGVSLDDGDFNQRRGSVDMFEGFGLVTEDDFSFFDDGAFDMGSAFKVDGSVFGERQDALGGLDDIVGDGFNPAQERRPVQHEPQLSSHKRSLQNVVVPPESSSDDVDMADLKDADLEALFGPATDADANPTTLPADADAPPKELDQASVNVHAPVTAQDTPKETSNMDYLVDPPSLPAFTPGSLASSSVGNGIAKTPRTPLDELADVSITLNSEHSIDPNAPEEVPSHPAGIDGFWESSPENLTPSTQAKLVPLAFLPLKQLEQRRPPVDLSRKYSQAGKFAISPTVDWTEPGRGSLRSMEDLRKLRISRFKAPFLAGQRRERLADAKRADNNAIGDAPDSETTSNDDAETDADSEEENVTVGDRVEQMAMLEHTVAKIKAWRLESSQNCDDETSKNPSKAKPSGVDRTFWHSVPQDMLDTVVGWLIQNPDFRTLVQPLEGFEDNQTQKAANVCAGDILDLGSAFSLLDMKTTTLLPPSSALLGPRLSDLKEADGDPPLSLSYIDISKARSDLPDDSHLIQVLEPPAVAVGSQGSILKVAPTALGFWDKINLSAAGGNKHIIAKVLQLPSTPFWQDEVTSWLQRVQRTFQTFGLGTHSFAPEGVLTLGDCFDSGLSSFLDNLARDSETWLDTIRSIAERLGTHLSQNKHVVLYAIQSSASSCCRQSGYRGLIRLEEDIRTMLNDLPGAVSGHFVVRPISPEVILESGNTSLGSQGRGLHDFAFSIYDQLGRVVQRQIPKALRPETSKKQAGLVQYPSFTLVPQRQQNVRFNLEWPAKPFNSLEEGMLLHIAYDARASSYEDAEARLTIVSATDERAQAHCAKVWESKPTLATEVAAIWSFAVKQASRANVAWRIVICKSSPMSVEEVTAWSDLVRGGKLFASHLNAVDLTLACVDSESNLAVIPTSSSSLPHQHWASAPPSDSQGELLDASSLSFGVFPRQRLLVQRHLLSLRSSFLLRYHRHQDFVISHNPQVLCIHLIHVYSPTAPTLPLDERLEELTKGFDQLRLVAKKRHSLPKQWGELPWHIGVVGMLRSYLELPLSS